MSEPLHGIAATVQTTVSLKSLKASTVINATGALSKAVDLEPFSAGGNDVIYGGVGNDSLHGGAGQDAISGAEAQAAFYLNPSPSGLIYVDVEQKFAAFSYNAPLAKIAGHPLNFNATDSSSAMIDDGADELFGDEGNDWLVGGTGKDSLYGGRGNDILNADDNLETAGVDIAPFDNADLAYGGAGRDTLLANVTTDRLIDWVGEFNNYYVPFNPFGQDTVVRQIAPGLADYLYAISRANGADQTRVGTGIGTAARNGEPFGELGVVLPGDAGFGDQTGPPVGPQPQ
jgi:Ca2+-binding RTX toxin-like protein